MGDRYHFMVKVNPEEVDQVIEYFKNTQLADFRDMLVSDFGDIISGYVKGSCPDTVVAAFRCELGYLIKRYTVYETGGDDDFDSGKVD